MVVVSGNSMEPAFRQGDLVIVRGADFYQVGDVVAYKNLQLGKFVIHRIIDEELNRYILKGDNNTWVDSFSPTANEIIGRHWIHIPWLGNAITWLRKPIFLAISASLLGGMLMFSWKKDKLQKTQRKVKKPLQIMNWITAHRIGQSGETIFLILGIFLIASIIFGVIAFARPVSKSIPVDTPYTHTGQFAYSAPAPTGVYDTASIQSGLPVFLKLNCEIKVEYLYTLSGDALSGITGNQSMSAVISDITGWKRTIPMQAETAFSGTSAQTQTALDLCQVYQLVSALREQTGLQRSEFSLAIIPTTTIAGLINGLALSDSYSPALNFQFNDVGFWMVSSSAPGEEVTDPLNPRSERMLREFIDVPETINFLGMKLPVIAVRWVASIFFILSAAGLITMLCITDKLSRISHVAEIQLRYSPILMDVQNHPKKSNHAVVEVDSIQNLARLAERNNSMMLHESNPDGSHTYIVHENDTVYRVNVPEGAESIKYHTEKEAELYKAMREEQFELYYQPIFDIHTRQITGVEALLRWNHPRLGILTPSAFIADAESCGMIIPLGEWVLRTACQQLHQWDVANSPKVSLAINISSKQIMPDMPALVKRFLKESKIEPSRLHLEFSETQLLENQERNIDVLDALRNLGVEISIDNYTGRASLSHLTRLQAKHIKFALSLISGMNDPQIAAIALSTIAAARTLGMVIEAVGVETEEQLGFLRSQLVNSAQGYMLGKPVSADFALQTLFESDKKVTIVNPKTS